MIRGASRVVIETLRGFIHGVTANTADRQKLTGVEKNLSLLGFALGLGLNQSAHGVNDTITQAFAIAKTLAMLAYGLPTQAPNPNVASVIGITLGFTSLVMMTAFRFIVENAKSLASVPSLLKQNQYPLEKGRQYYE